MLDFLDPSLAHFSFPTAHNAHLLSFLRVSCTERSNEDVPSTDFSTHYLRWDRRNHGVATLRHSGKSSFDVSSMVAKRSTLQGVWYHTMTLAHLSPSNFLLVCTICPILTNHTKCSATAPASPSNLDNAATHILQCVFFRGTNRPANCLH
jgi:hypothetical protein